MKFDIKIRKLGLADIKGAHLLSIEEGWNQTEDDWNYLLNDKSSICLGAVIDDHIVGTSVITIYSSKMAWLSMVLVHQEYRRLGISKTLLTQLLDIAPEDISIKLDASSVGALVYSTLGFSNEHSIFRMKNDMKGLNLLENKTEECISMAEVRDLHEIERLDAISYGASRKSLFNYFLNSDQVKAWKLNYDTKIGGVVFCRKGYYSSHIGPLIAHNDEEARSLLSVALHFCSDQYVLLDIPADKTHLTEWCKSIGFVESKAFTRMYRNHNVIADTIHQPFLISGPEFG